MILIPLYHDISTDKNYRHSVHPDTFARHLALLARSFHFVNAEELRMHLCSGVVPQERIAHIHFDDGYESVLINALPILEHFQIPFTVFISTALVGTHFMGRRVLDWDQIHVLARHPLCTIGSHGHTHTALSTCTPDDLSFELKTSHDLLESHIQRKVVDLAYPKNQVPTERTAVGEIYTCAFGGVYNQALLHGDTYTCGDIPRVTITTDTQFYKICAYRLALLWRFARYWNTI